MKKVILNSINYFYLQHFFQKINKKTACPGRTLRVNGISLIFSSVDGRFIAENLAGSGKEETRDGTAQECAFKRPWGIAVDEASGCCFVAEADGCVIRKISFCNSQFTQTS